MNAAIGSCVHWMSRVRFVDAMRDVDHFHMRFQWLKMIKWSDFLCAAFVYLGQSSGKLLPYKQMKLEISIDS